MEAEETLENKLIQQLAHGESQWTYRDDLKSEEQLWDNFFDILSRNNKAILNDVPLTDNEKSIIRSKIISPTFFKSAEWLAGANGQVKLPIQRDDTTLGTADLLVIDNTNIAGGNSTYEVVHQVKVHKRNGIDRNRRYDVTLLINGLPMIHIELKNGDHSPMEAFNQIQKYIDEGLFNGIYSTVQMFVVTNGAETQYIAAGQELRKKFLTNWVDKDNRPVHDYLSFARDVLSIPAAHHMVSDYTVLDNEQKNIILLRPYQIHAIEAIKNASIQRKSGFIWHTTGSGKTLTSYKVAHNLLSIPSIEKTIFLIDRNDLDTQTTSAFKTYAQSDTISVEKTANSYELGKKLVKPGKQVIVATRQKMQALFKRIKQDQQQKKLYQKLQQLNLAFIVDEAHRAVSPDQKNEIDAFFAKKPLWYGFTGTPIFDQNARQEKGANARTTEQQYGPCLHKYTIKDAIRDNAVLGFQIEEQKNYSASTDDKSDAAKLNQTYLSESHMRAVVKSIIQSSFVKLGIYNKDRRGYTYSAIFTTSSIKQAQKYYRLFKEIIAGKDPEFKVPNRIKRILPDFPKVAITYSIGENGDEDEANQNEMKQSLTDYNEMFHTNFDMAELKAYNINVNNRLARKKREFQPRDQQLDIVIVVDRLLTGFDAPSLSTLYIDRVPMPAKDLIQAFSRTNRIFDQDKKYGQIVTFQYPDEYKESINHALELYSDGGSNEVIAPDWKTSKARYKSARKTIDKYRNKTGAALLGESTEAQKKFLKDYQNFDKNYAAIQTYSEFLENNNSEELGVDDNFVEELQSAYQVVREKLRNDQENTDDNSEQKIDLDYELEISDSQTVNYGYILQLLQLYVPSDDNDVADKTAENIKQIDEYIQKFEKNNEALGKIVAKLWKEIQSDPDQFRNKQINEVIQEMINNAREDLLVKFAKGNSVNLDDLKFVVRNYDPEVDLGKQSGLNSLLANASYDEFKKTHPDVNRLKWKKSIRIGIRKLYVEQIASLEQD